MLLDVRERVQFAICALPGALNIPLRSDILFCLFCGPACSAESVSTFAFAASWQSGGRRWTQRRSRSQQLTAVRAPSSSSCGYLSDESVPVRAESGAEAKADGSSSGSTSEQRVAVPVYVVCRRGQSLFVLLAGACCSWSLCAHCAGNDSVLATQMLRLPPPSSDGKDGSAAGAGGAGSAGAIGSIGSSSAAVPFLATNIAGGLQAWSRHVDPDFPLY